MMRIYLVGGAVRDGLLGLPQGERDWVVTGATREGMLALGFRPMDAAIPVFSHPDTGEEYALARRERKRGPGHKGFEFDVGPDVTLEEDLARRDLTINAMARGEDGAVVDPFGGQADLNARRLRHVTPAFVEDPLRVLRLARFEAQLADFDFQVHPDTERLAKSMCREPDLLTLSPGRIWREMNRALGSPAPDRFVHLLERVGALAPLMPWLVCAHGAEGDGPVCALQRCSRISHDPGVRLAALLTAAAGCGAAGLPPGDWPLPANARALARACIHHPLPAAGDATASLDWLEAMDAWRRGERFAQVLDVWRAVCPGREETIAGLDEARRACVGIRPPPGSQDPRAAVRAGRLRGVREALAAHGAPSR